MKIAILRVGTVDVDVLKEIEEGLCRVFPETAYIALDDIMPMPEDTFNAARRQYNCNSVLWRIGAFLGGSLANRILGITEEDLYAPRLNFIFGEAQCPGKAAIISLHRLKPEFYGQAPDRELFIGRAVKEAVHEIGHTLGLGHCHDPRCIMFFSDNIQMTDTKECKFCESCWPKALTAMKAIDSQP